MKKLLFTLLFAAISLTTVNADPPTDYSVGAKARDFSLANVDGKMVSLKDFATTKGVIVIFTCNHCPFSVKYEDRIIALNNRWASKGFPVVAINPNDSSIAPDDSYDAMKVRAKEKGFTFPYLYDRTQEIAKTYGAARTPHAYLLQRQGNDFVVKYIGAIDDNASSADQAKVKYLDDAVQSLLNGKDPKPSSTKAIGCGVKYRGA